MRPSPKIPSPGAPFGEARLQKEATAQWKCWGCAKCDHHILNPCEFWWVNPRHIWWVPKSIHSSMVHHGTSYKIDDSGVPPWLRKPLSSFIILSICQSPLNFTTPMVIPGHRRKTSRILLAMGSTCMAGYCNLYIYIYILHIYVFIVYLCIYCISVYMYLHTYTHVIHIHIHICIYACMQTYITYI